MVAMEESAYLQMNAHVQRAIQVLLLAAKIVRFLKYFFLCHYFNVIGIAVCEKGCNGGSCDSPGMCTCPLGYSGNSTGCTTRNCYFYFIFICNQ